MSPLPAQIAPAPAVELVRDRRSTARVREDTVTDPCRVRELDARSGDGLDVRLSWAPVADAGTGLELEVPVGDNHGIEPRATARIPRPPHLDRP